MMLATLVDSKSTFSDMQNETRHVSLHLPQSVNTSALHCLDLGPLLELTHLVVSFSLMDVNALNTKF